MLPSGLAVVEFMPKALVQQDWPMRPQLKVTGLKPGLLFESVIARGPPVMPRDLSLPRLS